MTTSPNSRPFVRRILRGGRGSTVVLPFLALLVVWVAVKELFSISDSVLTPPTEVWGALVDLAEKGMLSDYVVASLRRLGVAALVGTGIGVPLGLLLGTSSVVSQSLETFLRFMQGVAGIAWLPLGLVWWGFSEQTILAVVLYTMIIPVTFNAMIGIRSVDANLALALRSLGAGSIRLARDVYLPGALPSILVGVRVGVGYGWRSVIVGEMVTARGGLGDLIFGARAFGGFDRIVAGMIVIGALYLLLDRLILQPIEDLSVARWGMLRA